VGDSEGEILQGMAITKMTLDEIKAHPSKGDRAKIKATTEQEIRQHMIEDREDPDAELREEDILYRRGISASG
jgi:hypothetical protein